MRSVAVARADARGEMMRTVPGMVVGSVAVRKDRMPG